MVQIEVSYIRQLKRDITALERKVIGLETELASACNTVSKLSTCIKRNEPISEKDDVVDFLKGILFK